MWPRAGLDRIVETEPNQATRTLAVAPSGRPATSTLLVPAQRWSSRTPRRSRRTWRHRRWSPARDQLASFTTDRCHSPAKLARRDGLIEVDRLQLLPAT